MPVYDYQCEDCGPFTVFRPMSECSEPHACPECATSAPRAFLTAPNFSGLSAERRVAHATNERSAHAPKTLAEHKASRHGAGCSCCGSVKKGRAVQRGRDGSKTFPTSRPWMISH